MILHIKLPYFLRYETGNPDVTAWREKNTAIKITRINTLAAMAVTVETVSTGYKNKNRKISMMLLTTLKIKNAMLKNAQP